jgi:hypothetical protein
VEFLWQLFKSTRGLFYKAAKGLTPPACLSVALFLLVVGQMLAAVPPPAAGVSFDCHEIFTAVDFNRDRNIYKKSLF